MSEEQHNTDHFVVLKLFGVLLETVGLWVVFAGSDSKGSFHCLSYYPKYIITIATTAGRIISTDSSHVHLTPQAGFVIRIKLLVGTRVSFS